jgi:glycosyltransferase involved in cell wall biosynthesis
LRNLPSPLTILHVTAPAEVGGLESVVTMLARGHGAMGHRVCVAALVDPAGGTHSFLDALEAQDVMVAPIALPTRAYGRERDAVRRLCVQLRPDVVHTHGYRSDVVDGSVARAAGIPVVSTVHGFTGGGMRNRAYEWIQERAFRDFDAVVAVSEPIVQRLARRGIERSRIHVIPNAFDGVAAVVERATARERLGIPSGDSAIGWVGRLSEEKGPDIFVESLALLSRPLPGVSIVGGGPDEAALRERAARLGVSGSVRWHGVVRGAGALLGAFDMLVLSSRTEGVPIVLLEAAAAGTPIVATRVGGVPSMFSDEEALLVPADDPRALAAAIDAVRSDPEAARARAEAARTRLERDFAPRPWLERYEELYRSLGTGRSATTSQHPPAQVTGSAGKGGC